MCVQACTLDECALDECTLDECVRVYVCTTVAARRTADVTPVSRPH